MKLFLHTCCAPCSVRCVESLVEEGIEPDLFWYNPNIHPYTEYRARGDSLSVFAKGRALRLTVEDEYGLRSFVSDVSSLEKAGRGESRCAYCYRRRLEKTALLAAENACDAFSTTLLISPWQNHALIRETGESLAASYGVAFLYRDFRAFFREGQCRAREAGYYMQKYCGCIYSEEERYLGKPVPPGACPK